MFTRLSRSWELVKASWSVLQADKELLVFPVVSTIGLIIVSIAFLLPLAGAGVLEALSESSSAGGASTATKTIGFIIGFLYYLVTYTVIIFANVALVGAAMMRLDGEDPTVSDGFNIASARIGKILGYALIGATVGMILRIIQNSDNIIAKIAAGIVGIAWSLATYMVVPVLVMEDLGPVDAVKRSASLLKQTWGEQLAGEFSMGMIFFLGALVAALVIGLPLFALSPLLGIIAIVIIAIITGLLNSALSGIYQAALYRYATQGETGEFFRPEMVEGAFKPKRGQS